MAELPTTYNPKDNTWSGAKRSCMYDYGTSVGRIIFNNMKNWPTNVCQVSKTSDKNFKILFKTYNRQINDLDGTSVTNAQGITWAIRIAQYLKQRGLNHKDVIGIAAKNTTYLMPLGVACLMNTTPFHSVNPMLDEGMSNHCYIF